MGLIKFVKDLWEITHLNTDKKINIPYGVSDVAEEYRKKEFSKDKIKIFMYTELSEFWDNFTPISAVAKCNSEQMNIELDIYGKGRALNKIKEYIHYKDCSNIKYLGSSQDYTSIYKDYDLFITPSYSLQAQHKALEILGVGLPLLISDVKGKGKSEFIKGNGYLMPENCINYYYKILKELYDDKSQLIAMGQKSRDLFEEMCEGD